MYRVFPMSAAMASGSACLKRGTSSKTGFDAFQFSMDIPSQRSQCVGDCALTCAGGERKNLVLRLVELGEKATQEDSRSRGEM